MKRILFGLLLCLLPLVSWAATSQLTIPGTPIVLQDTGGDYAIAMKNVATVNGSYSAQVDRGAGAFAALLEWRCENKIETTGGCVVGETIEYYIATSDGTYVDGGETFITGTTASTAGQLTDHNVALGLQFLGNVTCNVATANKAMTASGQVFIPTRYWQLVMWNGTTKTLKNTDNANTCSFTPIPFQQ